MVAKKAWKPVTWMKMTGAKAKRKDAFSGGLRAVPCPVRIVNDESVGERWGRNCRPRERVRVA